jgi:predicted XRE-type DNA-binding protein
MSEIEISNGNVYADIGVENPNEMLVKAQLAASIQKILETRSLTQTQAAEILGLPQPKLSRMLHGHFRGISEAKMMDCITRLGRDIRIVIGSEHRTGQTGRIEILHA